MNQFETDRLTLQPWQGLSSFWAMAGDEFAARRAVRDGRRRLAVELAGFTTHAERTDLSATLDGYADADTAEIRDLLNRPVAA